LAAPAEGTYAIPIQVSGYRLRGVSYSGEVRSTKAKVPVVRKATPACERNHAADTEDQADYRFSQRSIKTGKPIPFAKALKELGCRVER